MILGEKLNPQSKGEYILSSCEIFTSKSLDWTKVCLVLGTKKELSVMHVVYDNITQPLILLLIIS